MTLLLFSFLGCCIFDCYLDPSGKTLCFPQFEPTRLRAVYNKDCLTFVVHLSII